MKPTNKFDYLSLNNKKTSYYQIKNKTLIDSKSIPSGIPLLDVRDYKHINYSSAPIIEDFHDTISLPPASDIAHLLIAYLTSHSQKRSTKLQSKINSFFNDNIDIGLSNKVIDSKYFFEHYSDIGRILFGLSSEPKHIKKHQKPISFIITDHYSPNKVSTHLFDKLNKNLLVIFFIGPETARFKLDFLFKKIPINGEISKEYISLYNILLSKRYEDSTFKDQIYLQSLLLCLFNGDIRGSGNLLSDQHRDETYHLSEQLSVNQLATPYTHEQLTQINGKLEQYRDYQGNRTHSGYRLNTHQDNNIVITGGSTARCQELLYEQSIEGYLRESITDFTFSSLSRQSNLLYDEYSKLFHWLLHREPPRKVISISLINDFLSSFQQFSNLKYPLGIPSLGRFVSKLDRGLRKNLYFDDNALLDYLQKILVQFNSLAISYDFQFIFYIQPNLFDYPFQRRLYFELGLHNVNCNIHDIWVCSELRLKCYRTFVNTFIRTINRLNLSNTTLYDSYNYFRDETDQLLFLDSCHVNKHGSRLLADSLVDIIINN